MLAWVDVEPVEDLEESGLLITWEPVESDRHCQCFVHLLVALLSSWFLVGYVLLRLECLRLFTIRNFNKVLLYVTLIRSEAKNKSLHDLKLYRI